MISTVEMARKYGVDNFVNSCTVTEFQKNIAAIKDQLDDIMLTFNYPEYNSTRFKSG